MLKITVVLTTIDINVGYEILLNNLKESLFSLDSLYTYSPLGKKQVPEGQRCVLEEIISRFFDEYQSIG